MIEHPLDRDDIDLAQLALEVGTLLGRTVALSARAPRHSPLGEDGVLAVVDDKTGELLDTDPAVVAAAIAAHRPPVPEPDPLDGLETALAEATSVAKLRDALLTYARTERRRRGSRLA